MPHLTPKQIILTADPKARLDFYELLRGEGKPCWFIRSDWQGAQRSKICASPRAAWRDAADRFLQTFPALRKTVQS
jgi:hypothetical protein